MQSCEGLSARMTVFKVVKKIVLNTYRHALKKLSVVSLNELMNV